MYKASYSVEHRRFPISILTHEYHGESMGRCAKYLCYLEDLTCHVVAMDILPIPIDHLLHVEMLEQIRDFRNRHLDAKSGRWEASVYLEVLHPFHVSHPLRLCHCC